MRQEAGEEHVVDMTMTGIQQAGAFFVLFLKTFKSDFRVNICS